MGSINNWNNFQEQICQYFISLGTEANTNVNIKGVRTSHDIDIYVKTKFLGLSLNWIVEAKYWEKKVSKLHVLALRTIVEDTGADKGFIISEVGFQKGAYEAALNSNIVLKTFKELVDETKALIEDQILKTYEDRINYLNERYWSISKINRRKYSLRGESGELDVTYSVHHVLHRAAEAIGKALLKKYPINLNTYTYEKYGDLEADNFQQLINWFNLNLNIADRKIFEAEKQMFKDKNYNPTYKSIPDSASTSFINT